MQTLADFISMIRFQYTPFKKYRRALAGGMMYKRYSGAHLRRIRSVNGIGRPARTVLLWTRL